MCLEIILNNPLLGVGPDCLGYVCENSYMYKEDYFYDNTLVDKAHNEYLQIAATTGIPSLIIYIFILGIILVKLLKKFICYVKNKELNSDNAVF